MTFPPMLLVDEHRVGRKNLMVGSALVMAVASALLGAGIVYEMRSLSAVCMVLMVAGFSFGLGPIPFVILPELVPSRVSPCHRTLPEEKKYSHTFVTACRRSRQQPRWVSRSTGPPTLSSAQRSCRSKTGSPTSILATQAAPSSGSSQPPTSPPPSSWLACTPTAPNSRLRDAGSKMQLRCQSKGDATVH